MKRPEDKLLRHSKRYFMPGVEDYYILIRLGAGQGSLILNYRYLQDYMTESEQGKIISIALKNGGWKLLTEEEAQKVGQ